MNLEIDESVPLVKLVRGLAEQGLVLRTNPQSGYLRIEQGVEVREVGSLKELLTEMQGSGPAPDLYFFNRRSK